MLRGMISLSPSETTVALNALLESSNDVSFLTAKLESGKDLVSSYELSEEEVELLLDLLPPPTNANTETLDQINVPATLRATLHDFLSKLRSK